MLITVWDASGILLRRGIVEMCILATTMHCGGKPMEKSVFYPSQTSLLSVKQGMGGLTGLDGVRTLYRLGVHTKTLPSISAFSEISSSQNSARL